VRQRDPRTKPRVRTGHIALIRFTNWIISKVCKHSNIKRGGTLRYQWDIYNATIVDVNILMIASEMLLASLWFVNDSLFNYRQVAEFSSTWTT